MKKAGTSPDFYAAMEAEHNYHVYNRTNNKELLFRDDNDRMFFLERLNTYLSPYVDCFTYCLLVNHFHLLIRVKSMENIIGVIENLELKDRTIAQKAFLELNPEERTTEKVLENQFLRLFTSYSMHFNVRHKRKGNLFTRRFKRIEVEDELHFLRLVYYVHANPVKHKLMKDFRAYRWSSYVAILSDKPTKLARDEVLEWFNGREGFLEFHLREKDFGDDLKNYLIGE